MQQQMLVQDEETVELRETFTSLQQEVEAKTKKLKKVKYPQTLMLFVHINVCKCFIFTHTLLFFAPNIENILLYLL